MHIWGTHPAVVKSTTGSAKTGSALDGQKNLDTISWQLPILYPASAL